MKEEAPKRLWRAVESFITQLLLLSLAVVSACTLLFALGALEPAQLVAMKGPLRDLVVRWDNLVAQRPLWAGSGAVLVGLGCLAMMVGRFGRAPRGAPEGAHLLSSDEHGFTVVDDQGISAVAERAGCHAAGVVGCRVKVKGEGQAAVTLRAELDVPPGASIKASADEAREAIREAVEELIGLEVRSVAVKVRVLEPQELVRAVW